MGHGAWGMGHGEWGMGHWKLITNNWVGSKRGKICQPQGLSPHENPIIWYSFLTYGSIFPPSFRSHYLKQYELQKDNQEFQQYLAEQRMSFEAHQTDKRLQFEEKRDEKRLFVQWLMQKDSQHFQNEQGEKQFQRSIELANLSANLSKENQLEIEKFKDECARLQFEWQFEKRKELE